MKNEYTIQAGQHFSKGEKVQSYFFTVPLLLLGILLHSLNSVDFIYAAICYLGTILIHVVSYFNLLSTKYKVSFSKNCIYKIDGPDQYDINKIFGVGLLNHEKNSARFGWRSVGSKIEISWYVHDDGRILTEKMLNVDPEEEIELELNLKNDSYEFIVELGSGEKASKTVSRTKDGFFKLFIYKLFPYFGGNKTAPHDMSIKMIQLK